MKCRLGPAIGLVALLFLVVPVSHGRSEDNAVDTLQGAIAALEAGDVTGAERTLRPLAAGDPEATAWLAVALLKRGDRQGLAEAVQLLHEAAGVGNARARYLLAFQYAAGEGVPRDETRAALLFQEAAEGGIARAAYNLGVLYTKGRGVQPDTTQAMAWYRRAADAGDAYGAYALARAIERSPQASTRAAEIAQLYRVAADQGHLPAAQRYASLLIEGRGVQRDVAAAERYLRHAMSNGYPEAGMLMGDLSASIAMSSRGAQAQAAARNAVTWYRAAAEAGVAMAQFKLANALFAGTGVERDLARAEQWYGRAARQGLADAQYVLGIWRVGGVASPPDAVEGYMWLLLAERAGNTNAAKVRMRAMEKVSAGDQQQAEARAAGFRPQPERPRSRPDDEAPPLRPMPPRQ